jgi:hypothetical protein
VDRLLAAFLAARHAGSQWPGVEARVAVRLTDPAERQLVTEFIRGMVTGALTARRQVTDMAEIDAWAEAEITEDKLLPLMEGEIVTSQPGTQDGRWQCAYEFTGPGFDEGEAVGDQGSDVTTRITGSPSPPAKVSVPPGFNLFSLLPKPDLSAMSCTFDLSARPSGSPRRFV